MRGGEQFAIWPKGHASHCTFVIVQRFSNRLSAGELPQNDVTFSIRARRREKFAIRAESQAHHRTVVSVQRLTNQLSAGDVPKNHILVVAPGSQKPAIRAERHSINVASSVPSQWFS